MWHKLARVPNAVLPAVAVAVGWVAAGGTSTVQLTAAVVVSVLLHSVVTVWNDIEDAAGDAHNGIYRIGQLKQQGSYRGVVMLQWIAVALLAALSIVCLPAWSWAMVALYGAAAWLYNAKPFQASHRPVASIVLLGLCYAAVPFGLGASLGSRYSWAVLLLGVGWTVGRASLSLLKDYKDAPGDAVARKKTFLLVYGGTKTARLSLALAACGYLVCVVATASLAKQPVLAAATLAATAAWLVYERLRLVRRSTYEGLNKVFHDCLRYQLAFDAMVMVWLRTR